MKVSQTIQPNGTTLITIEGGKEDMYALLGYLIGVREPEAVAMAAQVSDDLDTVLMS